jgi:uncharacterized protein YneF (UPF0154 family)
MTELLLVGLALLVGLGVGYWLGAVLMPSKAKSAMRYALKAIDMTPDQQARFEEAIAAWAKGTR